MNRSTITKVLAGVALVTAALGGCIKTYQEGEKAARRERTRAQSELETAPEYRGKIRGIHKDTFVLNDLTFAHPNLYQNCGEGKFITEGPAGSSGLLARLDSAQEFGEDITVKGLRMKDNAICFTKVYFPDGTLYSITSGTLLNTFRDFEKKMK